MPAHSDPTSDGPPELFRGATAGAVAISKDPGQGSSDNDDE